MESKVGRRGKMLVKGNLPLRISEAALDDKIELECAVLEVQAKNFRLLSLFLSTFCLTGFLSYPKLIHHSLGWYNLASYIMLKFGLLITTF